MSDANYTVTIEEVAKGKRVVCDKRYDFGDDVLVEYWTGGDYGCDCNRELAFWKGSDMPTNEINRRHSSLECSDERYRVVSLVREGRVLLEESAG